MECHMYINMSDIDMELRPVLVNEEIVFVTRCGDLWRWVRVNKWSAPKFRKIVSKPRPDGYLHPMIGKRVLQHRIVSSAFLGLDMSDTKIYTDHINGMKHDNRLENLRLVTNQQNEFNNPKAKGYSWCKQSNKWHARIQLDGRLIHLGIFVNPEEARKAYLDAKLIHHKIP